MRNVTALAILLAASGTAWAQTAPAPPPATPAHTTGAYDPSPTGKLPTETEEVTLSASDVRIGARVADKENRKIGKVTAADAEGVTVDYGKATTKVPLNAFRKEGSGIVMNITRSDFIARASNPQ